MVFLFVEFPRVREPIVPLPQHLKEIPRHSREDLFRHSRESGNPYTSHRHYRADGDDAYRLIYVDFHLLT